MAGRKKTEINTEIKNVEEKDEIKTKEETQTIDTAEVKIDKKVRKEIPLNTLVACRNASKAELRYVSKKQMGYEVVWEKFGSIEYLELNELISLRNAYPRFFKDGWLIIDDVEIIEYLKLQKYYENIIDIDNLDKIFDKPLEEFKSALQKLPQGFKDTVVQRARELRNEGKFDSINKVEAMEKAFNIDLRL